ncbi:hypothetical protein Tsubulata_003896, partial [Turnera subulata]
MVLVLCERWELYRLMAEHARKFKLKYTICGGPLRLHHPFHRCRIEQSVKAALAHCNQTEDFVADYLFPFGGWNWMLFQHLLPASVLFEICLSPSSCCGCGTGCCLLVSFILRGLSVPHGLSSPRPDFGTPSPYGHWSDIGLVWKGF